MLSQSWIVLNPNLHFNIPYCTCHQLRWDLPASPVVVSLSDWLPRGEVCSYLGAGLAAGGGAGGAGWEGVVLVRKGTRQCQG